MKRLPSILGSALVLAVGGAGVARAQAHDQKAERHGGVVAMTAHNRFETAFAPDGVRIYAYTGSQAPMVVDGVSGTLTLRFKDGGTREITLTKATPKAGQPTAYFCTMDTDVVESAPGKCTKCGMNLVQQDCLYAPVDLASVEPGNLEASVALKGLAGDPSTATFTETFEGYAEPAHHGRADADGDHAGHEAGDVVGDGAVE